MLIETDESDGSLVKFYPEIGILANISKDHKPVPELIKIFSRFIENIKNDVIVNGECPFSRELSARIPPERVLTFGFTPESGVRAEEVTLTESGSTFKVQETLFSLSVPGKHNVANALATIALGIKLKIPLGTIRQALKMFRGVERRLSLVGETSGIKVFDDFSHNAAKIAAALETLKLMGSRLIVIYQPHGFGPTKLIKEELIATFNLALRKIDIVILLDIFYVGGTAEKTISSAELVREICVPQAKNLKDREQVIDQVATIAQPGDVVVVMGARDNSLTSMAQKILRSLKNKTVFSHKKKNVF
jgi:UDP-N-acetylmuramate--alanine ligase